jgi:hypothetical protein
VAKLQESFSGRREEVLRNLEVQYFVFDAADENAVRLTCALAPADGGLPASVDGYLLDYYSIEERVNDTTWRLLAHYKMPPWPNDPPPEGRFSFDTSGGTQHVTQSLQTVGRYGPKATDKLQGAIGFDGKNVQGVDITVPVFNFTESHWFTPDKITQAYKLLLFGKTGCYNTDAFRGFAVGSVLFLGAAGDRQGDNPDDQWELTFRFAAMPRSATSPSPRNSAGNTCGSNTTTRRTTTTSKSSRSRSRSISSGFTKARSSLKWG